MSELILTTSVDTDNIPYITFSTDTEEMLRLTKDGFFVKGIKVNKDDQEGTRVFEAFKSWLVWASLNRSY